MCYHSVWLKWEKRKRITREVSKNGNEFERNKVSNAKVEAKWNQSCKCEKHSGGGKVGVIEVEEGQGRVKRSKYDWSGSLARMVEANEEMVNVDQ